MKKILLGFVAIPAIVVAGAWMHLNRADNLSLTASEKQSLRDGPKEDALSTAEQSARTAVQNTAQKINGKAPAAVQSAQGDDVLVVNLNRIASGNAPGRWGQGPRFYFEVKLHGFTLAGPNPTPILGRLSQDVDRPIDKTLGSSSVIEVPAHKAVDVQGNEVRIESAKLNAFLKKHQSDNPWKICVVMRQPAYFFWETELQDKCVELSHISAQSQEISIRDDYFYPTPEGHIHHPTDADMSVSIQIQHAR